MYLSGMIASHASGAVAVQINNSRLCLAVCATEGFMSEMVNTGAHPPGTRSPVGEGKKREGKTCTNKRNKRHT